MHPCFTSQLLHAPANLHCTQTNMLSLEMWHAKCRWTLPGIWAYAAFITANNYLQAQKIVRPQVVTSALVLAIHPPLNWLCIYTLGMS